MKLSKILFAGIIASIVRYLINSVFGYYFAHLYDPISGLWRAMGTPSWTQNVIIVHVIIAFLTVFVYAAVNKALGKKAETTKKGFKFGFLIWFIRDIPGSLMTYVFMPVSINIVATWLAAGFLISIINGLIIAKIVK